MRVVYVARHGCGGAQDEDAIAHALRELGHEADCVHEDQPRKAARKAAGAGLLLFHKWPEAEAAPVLRAAAGACPRALWYFDLVDLPGDPSVDGRCAARRRWMTAVAPHVEFAFCTDGDWAARMTAEQEVADFGPRWVWLPQGADGRITGRGAPPPKTNKGRVPPLLFAGIDRGGGAGREAWCDAVRDRLGSLLLHVRSGVYREELRGLIAAGPVVLCPDSPLGSKYWSNRIYNAAGFGACVLHPYNENLADQYEDGTEVVYYRSVGRMCDLAEQLVGDADGRRLIGDAALARTARQHLYRHRVERLLAVVGEGADGRK